MTINVFFGVILDIKRITKVDKRKINDLDYEGVKFPVPKKDYCRIERQSNICIDVFCYEKD